jgi:hypothetical protein
MPVFASCFHHNKLGIEPPSWHLALACYIVPLTILLYSWWIFLSLFFIWEVCNDFRINDFGKWTFLIKQLWAVTSNYSGIGHFEPCVVRQKIIQRQSLLALSRVDSLIQKEAVLGGDWITCPGSTCVRLSSGTNCLTSLGGCSLSEVKSMWKLFILIC